MTSPSYDLLLLDFGGVCLLNPVELHHVAEHAFGLPPGTFTWMGPVDPATDDLYREMTMNGRLQEREYWARRAVDVGRAAGRPDDDPLSLTDYMTLLYTPAGDHLIRAGCFDVVDRARVAGLGVSVLTNDLRAFHGDDWRAGISLFDRIDHLVDCSDTGVLKPDPRAFTRALQVTGVAAGRTLFVDDQPLSVEGAEAVGIDAVWFDIGDPEASWATVAARLGL